MTNPSSAFRGDASLRGPDKAKGSSLENSITKYVAYTMETIPQTQRNAICAREGGAQNVTSSKRHSNSMTMTTGTAVAGPVFRASGITYIMGSTSRVTVQRTNGLPLNMV